MVGFLFWIARFIGRRMDFKLPFFVNLPFLVWVFTWILGVVSKQLKLLHGRIRDSDVNSNYTDIQRKFSFLKTFYTSNGFPVSLVNSNIKMFLQNRFLPSPLDSPSRKKFFFIFVLFWLSV